MMVDFRHTDFGKIHNHLSIISAYLYDRKFQNNIMGFQKIYNIAFAQDMKVFINRIPLHQDDLNIYMIGVSDKVSIYNLDYNNP